MTLKFGQTNVVNASCCMSTQFAQFLFELDSNKNLDPSLGIEARM